MEGFSHAKGALSGLPSPSQSSASQPVLHDEPIRLLCIQKATSSSGNILGVAARRGRSPQERLSRHASAALRDRRVATEHGAEESQYGGGS